MYETAKLNVCVLSPNLLIVWIVNKHYSRNNLRDFLKSWRNVKYRTSKNIKLQQILHFVQSLDKEIGVFDIVIFINPSDYLFIYLSNLALASYFNTLIRSKFNHATLYHTWISICWKGTYISVTIRTHLSLFRPLQGPAGCLYWVLWGAQPLYGSGHFLSRCRSNTLKYTYQLSQKKYHHSCCQFC